MQLVMCRIPAPVQHPTLLSQSLSGPLEAAAPFLHDAASLPHAQVLPACRLLFVVEFQFLRLAHDQVELMLIELYIV